MANYLQILTSLYGDPGVDTLPTATGKKGWVRYDTTGGILISDGAAWVLLSSGGGGSSNLDGLTDVDLTSNTPDGNDVLTFNGTAWVPAPPPGATGGEANTLTNVGTGSQIAKGKAGVNYDVRTFLAAAGGKITVTQGTNDISLQVVDASETQKGAVELSLANGTESAGGRAVQDNDPRLVDSRTPSSHTYASHTGIPATFAPSAHNHAGTEITSGTIPAAQLPSATNSVKGAVITSLSNGTENAGTKVILDNDTRLTNSRTPVTHNHSATEITSGTMPIAQLPTATESAKGIAELATSAEITAGLVVQASDARLSDARSPLSHTYASHTGIPTTFAPSAHISTHLLGGSDPLTIAYLSNASFVIYQTATHYVVRNNYTGVLQTFVNTDFAPALEWAVNNMVNAGAGGIQSSLYGGSIFIMRGKYTATSTINIDITSATRHGILIDGEGWGTEIALNPVGAQTDGFLIDLAAVNIKNMRITANANVTNLIHIIGHGPGQRRNDHLVLDNLQVEGPNGNAGWATLPHIPGQIGILLDGTSIANYFSTIKNCRIHSFEKGIWFKGLQTTSCFCLHNSLKWCETGIEVSDSSGQLQIDGAWIQGDTFTGTTGIDIKSTAGGYVYIDHVTSELHRESPPGTPVACQTVLIGTGIGNCFIGKHISNAYEGINAVSKTIINNSTQVNHTPLNWGWRDKNFFTLDYDNNLVTLNSSRRMSISSGMFYIQGTNGFNHIFTQTGNLAASRLINLPVLTANDQITCDNHPTTFTNKTIQGLKINNNAKTASYTALTTDDYIPCTPAANMTITLPSAGSGAGKILTIQKTDSSAFTVTIDGVGSEQVNGQLTMVLTTQYQSVTLFCNGTAWFTAPFSTERRGKSTASGNGSATTFNIPHGLGVIPHDILVQCSSHGGDFTRTEDATNIIVTFTSAAPGAGTNNVIFHWSAVP